MAGTYSPFETYYDGNGTRELGTLQLSQAAPAAYYTDTSARCLCGATIMLRTDGYWTHGTGQGLLCPEPTK